MPHCSSIIHNEADSDVHEILGCIPNDIQATAMPKNEKARLYTEKCGMP